MAIVRFPLNDRDRGEPCSSAPPTPPCVRVRTRRFGRITRQLCAGFTDTRLDGYGLRCSLPTRPRVLSSYTILVHRHTPLLHASFRTPPRDDALALRKGPASGNPEDFWPRAKDPQNGSRRPLRQSLHSRSADAAHAKNSASANMPPGVG